ncbi:MAG: hypothetical protein JKX84_10635, partial [Flavobacteriales bacterium]|nr:hypothetical protein [Flavobacteriales bacterium]
TIYLTREDNNTVTDDVLGSLLFDSTDDTAPSDNDASAVIRGHASRDHGNTNKGGYLTFLTKDDVPNATAATERMRIQANGNVGIGTDAPAGILHLSTTQTGNVSKLHNTGLGDGQLVGHEFGKTNSTNNMAEFRYNHVSDGNADNYVNLGLWGNANTLTVVGTGNVGIGTSGPGQKLQVNGTGRFTDLGGAGDKLVYTNNNGDLLRSASAIDANSLVDGAGAANRVTYWSDANTLTSNAEFLYGSTGNLSVINPESTTAEIRVGAAWDRPGIYSSQELQLFSDVTGIIFGDSNLERMRMTAAGNLGIGNTAPDRTLYVSGDIYASTTIEAAANNTWYLRGGDDHELRDVNVANTMGVWGRQNSDRGGIQLGSDGSFIFGDNGAIGIGSIAPLGDAGDLTLGNVGGTQGDLYLYGATAGKYSRILTSNGNLHIDAGFGAGGDDGIYLNWYQPGDLHYGGGASADRFAVFTDGRGYLSGNLGLGTTSPIQKLDVNGRINVANGVIQRGGAAITATSDLGLYSRVAGNWMRIVTNNAPINFFSDDNVGTSINVSIANTGVLEAQKGLRTERHIRFYKRSRGNGQGGVDNLGNYDFCYLAGVAFRNTDSNIDEDDDYQCNVYSTDINGSAEQNEGENEDFSANFSYTNRPYWRLYSECYADCSNSTCTAMCINFDY